MSSHQGSRAKLVTWTFALVTTVGASWVVIGDPGKALAIGFIATAVKIGISWFRERFCERSWFGRVEASDFPI